MDVEIRAARLSDVDDLLALYRALDTGDDPPLPTHRAQARFEELTSNPDHRIYVAVEGDRVVGTFALVLVGGLAHGARPQCIVEDVVVATECRGRGIGQRMMRFAMHVSAAERCYKLALSSHVRREAAHQFYEGLGFRRHGYSFLIDPVACTT